MIATFATRQRTLSHARATPFHSLLSCRGFRKRLSRAPSVASHELRVIAMARKFASGVEANAKEKRSHARIMVDKGRPNIEIIEGALSQVKVDDDMLDKLFSVLIPLGYWPQTRGAKTREAIAAIAKFFYVNKLGPLMVYPFSHAVSQAWNYLKENPIAAWNADPGDLIYLVPIGGTGAERRHCRFGGPDSAKLVAGGGPRILRASPKIMEDVLIELGYWEHDGGLGPLDVATSIFCNMNVGKLQKAGMDLQKDANGMYSTSSECPKRLNEVLVSQSIFQEWKVPPRDDAVRKFLKAKKRIGLSAVDAPRKEMSEAMEKFLKQPSRSYHEAVLRIQQIISKDKSKPTTTTTTTS